MQIRRAGPADVDLVVALRLAFLADEAGDAGAEPPPRLVDATRSWVARLQGDGRFHSWLAEETQGRRAIGIASLLLHDLPPRRDDLRTVDGRLLNVWVTPDRRRQGVGRSLVRACLGASAELHVRTFSLHATADARALYEASGFRPGPAWMERPAVEPPDRPTARG
jgi:GNAT superfamily N-acetyltransferase